MATTTISTKFQIVIPKEVREKLRLVPHQRLLEGVFQPILSDVEHFAVRPERFVEGGDAVVASQCPPATPPSPMAVAGCRRFGPSRPHEHTKPAMMSRGCGSM